jgi:hypothetical protein
MQGKSVVRVGIVLPVALLSLFFSSCANIVNTPNASSPQGLQNLSGQSTAIPERIFEADFEAVWNALLDVLVERNESINTADKTRGLILTNFSIVTTERLKEIAQDASENAQYGGQYSLTIEVEKLADRQTRVGIEPLIVEINPFSANPVGGRILSSNGTLEAEIFAAIADRLNIQNGAPPALPEEVAQFDTNGNGVVDDDEFLTVVDLWIAGALGDDLFFEVVDAWVLGSK